MGGLTHAALFTWKQGTTEDEIRHLREGLAALPSLIPEIEAFRFGADAGLVEGNADFGVVAEFADEAAFGAYSAHPAHREVIERRLKPILDRRTAVQLER